MYSGDDIQRIINIKNSGDITINGEKLQICTMESRIVPNYMYVLTVPYSVMSAEMRGMYLQFILAVLCLILIEVIIIIIISTYIYQPFKTMFSNVDLFFSKESDDATSGTFDELVKKDGIFAKLVKRQVV